MQHANTCARKRVLRVLLGHVVIAVLLLACGAPAALVANKQATAPGGLAAMSVPIPWDELAATAPCRIAAAKAATVNGLLYSQGGAKPNDPIDPTTGTFYSRTGPHSYDCSGMTQVAYAQAGVAIGPTTVQQVTAGTLVSCTAADLRGAATTCWATGDLLFFLDEAGTAQHVELYVRDGTFASCLNWQENCRVWERSPASFPARYLVRRIVNDCVRSVQVAVGDVVGNPTSYTAKWGGVTYTGWAAQVLHHLFGVVPGYASTYADHDQAGGGLSADLWTEGAAYGADNSGMASMDALAAYIAANMQTLHIRYVVWEQRINTGSGWTRMADRGNFTQNHMDHLHITWEDVLPSRYRSRHPTSRCSW